MNYLPEVEDGIRNTMDWIRDDSNQDDHLQGLAALDFGYNIITSQWEEKADDIVNTLICLLSNNDRRIVLLAVTYLGIIQQDRVSSAVHAGGIRRAIGPIKDVALNTDGNDLRIAVGVTNAILGDKSSKDWMAREMILANISDEANFRRSARLGVVVEIAKGWK
jgi:hypothetical protein